MIEKISRGTIRLDNARTLRLGGGTRNANGRMVGIKATAIVRARGVAPAGKR